MSDPKIREGLKNGELDAWKTVGLDSLGLAPVGGAGVGVGKVGWGLLRGGSEVAGVKHAAESLGVLERLGGTAYSALTHEPGIFSKAIGGLPGVPKVVEALTLDHAARGILQATGVAGKHAEVVTATEAIDLFSRYGKVVNSMLTPVMSQGD